MTYPENGNEVVPVGEVLPAVVPSEIEPAWESPSTALEVHLPGVFLGNIVDHDGWLQAHKDRHEQPVVEAGIGFVVSQSSAGGTYLWAKAMTGYQVEALNPDASSRRSMWRAAPEGEEVSVDSDWGKIGSLKADESFLGMKNVGNPGVRSGIIRVTDPEGGQRHYFMGAEFSGRDNDWRVTGAMREVWPNEQMQLAVTPRALSGKVLDPGLISHELEATVPIDAMTVDALTTAFEHATPDVWILHAEPASATAAEKFSHVVLNLLTTIAKQQPEILDGTEEQVDELGRRARLINRGTQERGFLKSLASDEENRVSYLESVDSTIAVIEANSGNAHSFTFFTKQALDILKTAFRQGIKFDLRQSSSLVTDIEEIVQADVEQNKAAQSKRAEVLRGSILDSEVHPEGLAYRSAIPGQKVEIDLDAKPPLLTPEQTFEAFYYDGQTDSGSARTEGYRQSTLAIIEIGGKRHALIDARFYDSFLGPRRREKGSMGSGRTTKTGNHYYKGERDDSQFKLLEISNDPVDQRYGVRVSERGFVFEPGHNNYNVISGLHAEDKQGFAADENVIVTLDFDEAANKLTIMSTYRKVGVIAPSAAVSTAPWTPYDRRYLDDQARYWGRFTRR